jgi:xanthine dehydrogenase accessory factor
MRDWIDKVVALRRGGHRFATATVVGRRAPVSAHLGDRAIIHADGRMEGFIGGACSREIVRQQALDAIRTGRSRLVSIRPDPSEAERSDPEHVIVPMTCVSEGAVEVYVEPDPRPRRLVVVGATPVAESLTRAALAVEYEVARVVDGPEVRDLEADADVHGFTVIALDGLAAAMQALGPDAAAVVASQGHYDEEALEIILRHGASYVGLVASPRRGAAVKQLLVERGVSDVERVRHPAGLDIGARTAPEIALSILAEIVQLHPDQSLDVSHAAAGEQPTAPLKTAEDPVCHMKVAVETARHTADVEGTRYYFCCAGCQHMFVKDPSAFLTSHS